MEAKKRCVICSQVYVLSQFVSKYSGDVMKLCIHCAALGTDGQEKRKKELFAHLWKRSDGSMITDPWEVVDDGEKHVCRKCKKLKAVKEFNLNGGKYNPRLTKACSECLRAQKKSRDEKEHRNFFSILK